LFLDDAYDRDFAFTLTKDAYDYVEKEGEDMMDGQFYELFNQQRH